MNTENPSLYDPYCYPHEQKTLYNPSGYGMASLFPQESFEEAEKKALPMNILDSCVRDYINRELKEAFDAEVERQMQGARDWVERRVREVVGYCELTNEGQIPAIPLDMGNAFEDCSATKVRNRLIEELMDMYLSDRDWYNDLG